MAKEGGPAVAPTVLPGISNTNEELPPLKASAAAVACTLAVGVLKRYIEFGPSKPQ